MSLASLGTKPGQVETLIKNVPYHSDPLSVMEQVCDIETPALLLESAEIDSKDNLKSLLMTSAAVKFECNGDHIVCEALTENGLAVLDVLAERLMTNASITRDGPKLILTIARDARALDEDRRLKATSVFDVLRSAIKHIEPLRDHDNAVFLGGVFAYDVLASYEVLPSVEGSQNTCPDYLFYLAETLVTFDHQSNTAELIGSVFSAPDVAQHYFSVSQKIEHLAQAISEVGSSPSACHTSSIKGCTELKVDKDDDTFKRDVISLKEHILSGDIFQVVPSRTFSLPCLMPREAYRSLKQSNPSPYMFYLQTGDFALFGASPESALKYCSTTNQVEVYPIAGTRPRGKRIDGTMDWDLDSRLELSLREDEKEKAEHIMLVDLARNDVAKVSQPGSRHVKELLKVDRYSHVMHLVSRVVGQLRNDLDALHAYQACMNMGTLVGAPKVSAATLIRQVEKQRRGSYGGAVGYLNGKGDMDTCIVIRSAFIKDGMAHIQAGAGVVYDSDPQAEADETRSKAQAVISAIIAANAQGGLA
ncbi:anthranilate synthase component 1 [Alteromonas sediminis]|uniref:Anthranilate synthase component 1 n=1 Tax=Alteromonas sediminis TaxID=2259342 RepID=A0A3N5ZCL5_9ALTE|nr:anthranilate synthase component 1 [Alteromonas sediminis]RPJ67658.1 anthranilate synthase component 1 [Alteromonas sediminis]